MEFLLLGINDYTSVVTLEEKNWDELSADGIIPVGKLTFCS
jgi:hypothetical protein